MPSGYHKFIEICFTSKNRVFGKLHIGTVCVPEPIIPFPCFVIILYVTLSTILMPCHLNGSQKNVLKSSYSHVLKYFELFSLQFSWAFSKEVQRLPSYCWVPYKFAFQSFLNHIWFTSSNLALFEIFQLVKILHQKSTERKIYIFSIFCHIFSEKQ